MSLGRYESISKDITELGMWQVSRDPEWSAVFPPGEDPDPAIVSAIRKFAPTYVPLWVRRFYVTPQHNPERDIVDERIYGYHAIGVWSQDPEESIEDDVLAGHPVNLLRPLNWPFRGGRVFCANVLADQWREDSWQYRCNVPEPALPYDWRVYDWMKGTAWRMRNVRIGADTIRILKARRARQLAELQGVNDAIRNQNRIDRYQLLRPFGKATSSTAVAPSKELE